MKDSDNLIQYFKILGKMNNDGYLCTADALKIFPNIATVEGLTVLLLSYETKLATSAPNLLMKQILKSLHLLMKQNVFKFGEIFTDN